MTHTPCFDGEGSVCEFTGPFGQTLLLSFDNSSTANSFARDMCAMASTSVDWKETEKEHVFKADVPGVKKEEIHVTLEGRTLSISGRRSKQKVQKMDTWHRAERSTGRFKREFKMPENVDLDHVTAKEADGVLTVIVPKLETKGSQPRRIDIGTSGGGEKSGQAAAPAANGSS